MKKSRSAYDCSEMPGEGGTEKLKAELMAAKADIAKLQAALRRFSTLIHGYDGIDPNPLVGEYLWACQIDLADLVYARRILDETEQKP